MNKKLLLLTLAASLSLTACNEPAEPAAKANGDTLTAGEPSKGAAFEVRLVLDSASPDSEQLTYLPRRPEGGKADEEQLHVQKKPLLERSALGSAAVQKDSVNGLPRIQVTFTKAGAKLFAEVTRNHSGKRLAILIGGIVYTAPRVMTEISGGVAVIQGSFSEEEATQLAAKLNRAVTK